MTVRRAAGRRRLGLADVRLAAQLAAKRSGAQGSVQDYRVSCSKALCLRYPLRRGAVQCRMMQT